MDEQMAISIDGAEEEECEQGFKRECFMGGSNEEAKK